ncbi:MAG: peptidoglycan-binding domain-containing protein [Mariprofundaceae bacterium]
MPRPLKMFMRGKRVTMLQELLHRIGHSINDQPGLFGATTRDAVKDFQKQREIKVTGQVDDDLMQLIQGGQTVPTSKEKPSSEKITASTPVNQQQLDALIRLLIRKELMTEKELQTEMKRPQPVRVTQPPLT